MHHKKHALIGLTLRAHSLPLPLTKLPFVLATFSAPSILIGLCSFVPLSFGLKVTLPLSLTLERVFSPPLTLPRGVLLFELDSFPAWRMLTRGCGRFMMAVLALPGSLKGGIRTPPAGTFPLVGGLSRSGLECVLVNAILDGCD